MDIRKQITSKLLSFCRCNDTGSGEILVIEENYTFSGFQKLIESAQKNQSGKFHVIAVENCPDEMIPINMHEIRRTKKKQKTIEVTDITGFYKVRFSDGASMFYAKWYSGSGKNEAITGLFAARQSVWMKFISMQKRKNRKNLKPPSKGCYRIKYDMDTEDIYYVKKTDLQENEIFSPAKQKVEDDMRFFFDNLCKFTRFNMSGIRKALFIGEPGTGKSSFCTEVARNYGKNCLVAFATHFYEVAVHISKTSHFNMRSVIILEDADSSLHDAKSNVLNLLDGIDQPRTKKGTYLILTTNYPQKIEPRILSRPGRIDKIFHFGVLNEEDAFQCARHYFSQLIDFERISKNGGLTALKKTMFGLTGAQIRELSYATASYAVGQNLENITIETIRFVKNEMMESIREVNNLAKETSTSKRKNLGFELDF
jgi:SpoVK/Ycf46/Vps4 family AAA+-type ATPase